MQLNAKITESKIETFAIELLEKLGYQYIYAQDVAPDKVNGEAREGALGYSDTSLNITIPGEVRVGYEQ